MAAVAAPPRASVVASVGSLPTAVLLENPFEVSSSSSSPRAGRRLSPLQTASSSSPCLRAVELLLDSGKGAAHPRSRRLWSPTSPRPEEGPLPRSPESMAQALLENPFELIPRASDAIPSQTVMRADRSVPGLLQECGSLESGISLLEMLHQESERSLSRLVQSVRDSTRSSSMSARRGGGPVPGSVGSPRGGGECLKAEVTTGAVRAPALEVGKLVAVPPRRWRLEIGARTLAGRKRHHTFWMNQDAHLLMNLSPSVSIVGVFDGHGEHGRLIANQARRLAADHATGLPAQGDPALPEALARLFKIMQKAIESEGFAEWSGTTATLALIDMSRRTAAVAHVGDSKLMVFCGSKVIFETQDHVVDAAAEFIVCASGGEVREQTFSGVTARRIFIRGTARPGISISRSLGDKRAKSVGVLSEATIDVGVRFPPDSVLVVASDGVWDKLPKEALATWCSGSFGGGCAPEVPTRYRCASSIAREVVLEARARWHPGRDIDDITAVVVRSVLDHGGGPHSAR